MAHDAEIASIPTTESVARSPAAERMRRHRERRRNRLRCLTIELRETAIDGSSDRSDWAVTGHSQSGDPMPPDTEIPVTSTPTEPHSAAAQRMRDHRERRRAGLRCVTVQVFEKEIEALVSRGLLEADARNDGRAVREALHKHLGRTLRPTP
jgi:hypothetical protein